MRLRLPPPLRARAIGSRGVFGALRGVFYGWYLVGVASMMLTIMSLTVFQSTGHLLRRAQPRVRLEPHPALRRLRLLAHTGRGHRAYRRLPHRPVRQPHHVHLRLLHDGRGIPHAVPASRRRGAAGRPPLLRGDAVLHRPGSHHHRIRAGRLAHHDVHGQ